MLNIFIKSFNRAYYLDRCLYSISENVLGDYEVIVLDDGTPDKYLDKILEKHPHIKIKKSKTYEQKQVAIKENIETGKEINGFQIPTDLWINAVQNGSNYFIMTEDDVWFTKKINVNKLVNDCEKHNINLLKLAWLGQYSDDRFAEISSINEHIETIHPKNIKLFPQPFMEWFLYNKHKFFTIFYKLKQVDNYEYRKYWLLNSILMGLYKKKYWLEIWKNFEGKMDEKKQLLNASLYFRNNKNNKNFISRLKSEVMKTTFQSSATNSYHQYGCDFDVNKMNYIINEAWMNDEFNSNENFPKDFSISYLESFFNNNLDISEFRKWRQHFKQQYENIGCQTD